MSKKEFPANFKRGYDNVKANAKTPWWTFSGLILLAALITAGIVQLNENDKENAIFINAPKEGDIYKAKLGNKEYTLYKYN